MVELHQIKDHLTGAKITLRDQLAEQIGYSDLQVSAKIAGKIFSFLTNKSPYRDENNSFGFLYGGWLPCMTILFQLDDGRTIQFNFNNKLAVWVAWEVERGDCIVKKGLAKYLASLSRK